MIVLPLPQPVLESVFVRSSSIISEAQSMATASGATNLVKDWWAPS
jgi:hypothetical protein